MKVPRFLRFGAVNGVPVYVHWSAVALAGVWLLASLDRPLSALTGTATYAVVLITHELGHQFAAKRLGYDVRSVEIYPFHGLCRVEQPYSIRHQAIVAWGGVLMQFLIAVPVILRLTLLGYSHFAPINAALAIAGPANVAVALFNLLPLRPLDGATAWKIFGTLFTRRPRRSGPLKDETALEAFNEILRKNRGK